MKKLILKIVVGLLVLIIAAVVGVVVYIDKIVETGMERGGNYALQVATEVDDADLRILGGQLTVARMTFRNPEGYTSPHLMQADGFDVQVDTGTIRQETVIIPRLEMSGLDIYLERRNGKSNLAQVMENARRLGRDEPTGPQEPAPDEQGGKKVTIQRVVIRNIVLHPRLIDADRDFMPIRVEELVLENVGSDGVPIADAIGQLLPAILAAVLEEAAGILPADVINDLQGSITGLTAALGENATALLGQAGDMGQQLAERSTQIIGDTLQSGGDAVRQGAEGVGGAIRGIGDGLFGNGNDDQPDGQ